eukprot:TRINITY_DN27945_c0_g1_i1.p1 TRINITY_DN27945_c0_g1~~TRINITY_DN27945_c0_g1_i1.p1  ORF type:complete len:595 (+),score=104.53 TRINITY_DN27945_c0_g1_i1:104-1888(+)
MQPSASPRPRRHIIATVCLLGGAALWLTFGFTQDVDTGPPTAPLRTDPTGRRRVPPSDLRHTDRPTQTEATLQEQSVLPQPDTTSSPSSSASRGISQGTTSSCKSTTLLPSAPGFTVELCWDSASCEGRLQVSRTSGCTPMRDARSISNDAGYDAWVKRAMGPDHYRLLFKSTSGVAQRELLHAGNCVYTTGGFALRGEGRHYIALELLYKSYEGIDEVRNIWPPLQKTPILPHGIQALGETAGTAWHPGQLTPPSDSYVTCSGGGGGARGNAQSGMQEEGDAQLPGRLFAHLNGRWAVDAGRSGTLYTKVRVKKISRQPILFNWTRQAHPEYTWVAGEEEEARGGDTGGALDQCVAKLKAGPRVPVIITGDSQLRAAYFGFVNILNGGGEKCVRNISSPSHVDERLFPKEPRCLENVKGKHRHNLGGVGAEFLDDPYISGCPKLIGSGHKVVVLGFAQHPASRKHWPFKKFNQTMSERAKCVSSMLAKGKVVVWLMAPKYPDTKVGFPVGVMDWRTDARLLLFNSAARTHLAAVRQALQDKGDSQAASRLHIIEAFDISAPLGHSSSDQAHYNNVVLHAISGSIATSMCAGRG